MKVTRSMLILSVVLGLTVCTLEAQNQQQASHQPTVGGGGTTNFVPLWTPDGNTLGNSAMFQSGTGSNAKIGIGLTNPLATLDVKGSELVRGLFELSTLGLASPTKGYNSQPFNLESSAYNSSTKAYTLNHFQWQAEPTGNNTSSPSATLNLLFGTDPANPAETGLKINRKGLFTFGSGQTFPGTVTNVIAGTGLTGGGSGTPSVALDTGFTDGRYAQLAQTNTFPAQQKFSSDIFVSGFIESFVTSGVLLQADSSAGYDTYAINGLNNSGYQTLELGNNAVGFGYLEVQFNATRATFTTDNSGNTTAIGTKSAAVPLNNGQMVKVFSMESPEVWFEDFGSGQLAGGVTTVALESKFMQTVKLNDGYHVFLTPKGDCKGLYVFNETPDSFEVREMGGGQSSVEFDYRIVAHRSGYEMTRLPVAMMPRKAPTRHSLAALRH